MQRGRPPQISSSSPSKSVRLQRGGGCAAPFYFLPVSAAARLFLLSSLLAISTAVFAFEPADVSDGGKIEGRVIWSGEIPTLGPLKVTRDVALCGESVPQRALIVNPATQGVRYAVVYLEGVERGRKGGDEAVLHSGRDAKRPESVLCDFEEHVLTAGRNGRVRLTNADPVLHNPHGTLPRGATVFNVVLMPGREAVRRIRVEAKPLRVQCDAHPHMFAWLFTLEHGYVAITDSEGRFSLTDVPPGRYRLVAWHEGYTIRDFSDGRPLYDDPHILIQEVELLPGGSFTVDFTLSARGCLFEGKPCQPFEPAGPLEGVPPPGR